MYSHDRLPIRILQELMDQVEAPQVDVGLIFSLGRRIGSVLARESTSLTQNLGELLADVSQRYAEAHPQADEAPFTSANAAAVLSLLLECVNAVLDANSADGKARG